MSTLIRVVHQQLVRRSLLIDKVDTSQGNFEGYAQRAKQKIYVPYVNPLDAGVNGYIDMVPTDEVLLSLAKSTIAGLVKAGHVTTTLFNSALTAAPHLSGVTHSAATAVGGQTGAAATISAVVSGVATLTGLTGMTAASVGRQVTVTGAATGANNGSFYIVQYVSATSVKVANSGAVAGDVNNGSLGWTEKKGPRTVIAGTVLASLAPDRTSVVLTNVSAVSQTLYDAALIADGSSLISPTAIEVSDALVLIGTPTTAWTAKVQANSKSSNTATI